MSFYLPRLLWLALNPLNILLALLLLGLLLLLTPWRRAGRRLLAFGTVVMLLLAILPIGDVMMATLEARYPPLRRPPHRVDGIIVLGGALQPKIAEARGVSAINGNAERLLTFAELALRYPKAKLVFSGGKGSLLPGYLSEADVAARVFRQVGLNPRRILFEATSRNTNDHPRLIGELIRPKQGEVWLLVTSAFHMPRAIGVFHKQGWPVIAYPCDYRTLGLRRSLRPRFNLAAGLHNFDQALRAWTGLIGYYLLGRTSELLPGADFTTPGAAGS